MVVEEIEHGVRFALRRWPYPENQHYQLDGSLIFYAHLLQEVVKKRLTAW
jgi:hypothetical protein